MIRAGRIRVNIGCGATPTEGWVNLDNSWTVRLAARPLLLGLLHRAGLASGDQLSFAAQARAGGVRWANALALPFEDGTVEVAYSSHMLEHLGRADARAFLAEVRRVLAPDGFLRLALPDLSLLVARYRDADEFVAQTYLAHDPPRGLRARLRALAVGERDHAWMYDGPSLLRLVTAAGYSGARILPAGETTIPLPGPLDLRERESESVYLEARPQAAFKPQGGAAGHFPA